DEEWCRFLAGEDFAVGLSLDGPQSMHDRYRVTKNQESAYEQTVRGYELLRQHGVGCDILCVVNERNVQHPSDVYRFFKKIGARYITFLPLVEPRPDAESGASRRSVPPEAWGDFLCTVFEEWTREDVGEVEVQIFEEAARTAFGQEHALCIFRETCGDIPVVEHNGDFYSCDHFVDSEHRLGNIREHPLVDLLENPTQRAFGRAKLDDLPGYCRACDVRDMCNGGCPKNRFLQSPDGEAGLNYLCTGYKRFFIHCKPFITALRALRPWSAPGQSTPPGQITTNRAPAKAGRNDPCPCGSGRKYKSCCLGK
ncbi:MAG: SPASM domain-containing protein, partial [Lentisphaerae bacterium]|nr:SPASM domain-containing protein [Lentisphaerota bacterium]